MVYTCLRMGRSLRFPSHLASRLTGNSRSITTDVSPCDLDEEVVQNASRNNKPPAPSASSATSSLAQQEGELQKAVQPGSPISAPLSSACQPLMVGPGGATIRGEPTLLRKLHTQDWVLSGRGPLLLEFVTYTWWSVVRIFFFFTKMHILRVRTGCLTPAQLIVRHRHIHGRAHAPACSGQALRSGVPATLVQFALSFTCPSSCTRAMARLMGALAIAMHAAAGAERCARGVCSPMAIAAPVRTSKLYDACVTGCERADVGASMPVRVRVCWFGASMCRCECKGRRAASAGTGVRAQVRSCRCERAGAGASVRVCERAGAGAGCGCGCGHAACECK